jgi:hypothetical protein
MTANTLPEAVNILKYTPVATVREALMAMTGEKIARINGYGDVQVYSPDCDSSQWRNLKEWEIIELANHEIISK